MAVNSSFPASTNRFCPAMSSLKVAYQTTGSGQRLASAAVHQASVTQIWRLKRPTGVPAQHYQTFLLLCAGQLWKQHGLVFEAIE